MTLSLSARVRQNYFKVLVNSASALNLLSLNKAIELVYRVTPLTELLANTTNRLKIKVYRITVLDIEIIDSRGYKQLQTIPFIIVDITRYNIFLGLL